MGFDSGEKGLWEMVSGLCGELSETRREGKEQEAPKSTEHRLCTLAWANVGKIYDFVLGIFMTTLDCTWPAGCRLNLPVSGSFKWDV